MALRTSEEKFILDNNAWRPSGPNRGSIVDRLENYNLEVDPLEARNRVHEEITEEQRVGLERIRAQWRKESQAPVLTFSNSGPGVLSGEIRGPMVRPMGTKTDDLDCDCLVWSEMGRATFEIPAGQGFSLRFEKVFGSKLKIEGEIGLENQRTTFRHTWNLKSLESPEAVVLNEVGRWIQKDVPADLMGAGNRDLSCG